MIPCVYSILLWWATTGVILYLDRLDPSTFRLSMACGVALLLPAAIGLRISGSDTTLGGAYVAFTCTLMVWGCLEMSFLLGFVTGPRRQPYEGRRGGWRHFAHATQAILYNEIATIAGALLIMTLTWNATNRIALGTYGILWAMRLSAKLNLFLGVQNIGEQFLPPHLVYVASYFNRRAMNWLFPFSVSAAAFMMSQLIWRGIAARTPFQLTADTLMASLLGLALLEHLFMVIPLPTERLWRWAMRTGRRAPG